MEALQNVAKATVCGLQVSAEIFVLKNLSFQTHANRINGKETDDVKNEQVPLRHAAPFYGSSPLKYRSNKLPVEASSFYNSKITDENLAPSGQANTDSYVKDSNGKPYAPGRYTLKIKASYQITKNLMATQVGKMLPTSVRTYSSGIVGWLKFYPGIKVFTLN